MRLLAALLAVMLLGTAQADELPACASSPEVTGACFKVRGRLTSCSGVPNVRIWIVGTKRILGVADPTGNVAGDRLMPKSLDRAFTAPCDKAAFGDFTVCPLEKDRPGVMRRVCIAKTERVRLQDDW